MISASRRFASLRFSGSRAMLAAIRRASSLVFPRVDVRERLPLGIPDDIAAGYLVGPPGCGEAAW
jgi:hypothetical protein